MATLRVFFIGVCTHLWEFTSRETEHRVVLINASRGDEINGKTIHAHHAWLLLPGRERPERVPLPGVRLTVPNASDPDVTYDSSYFRCIPRVTTYAANLPPLSKAVVNGRDPALAAAYFDAAGRFSGGVDDHGASIAWLDVETTGDPVLRIEGFRDNSFQERILRDGDSIQIENLGPGSTGDSDHDFLLNFKIAQSIPTDAGWPKTAMSCHAAEVPFPYNTVGPGCSNSNYP
jgi:hypothetical protein